MIKLSTKVRDEWIRYTTAVLDKRKTHHPELRAEAFESFIGGAFGMFRLFTDEIGKILSPEQQRQAINEIHEELRVLALQAGRK